MRDIRFGTDGWRGIIADTFTFANVARVTQATAGYWNAHPIPGTRPLVVVGYDRRFLSDRFARSTAEIMAANGMEVLLTDRPTPTPSVSFAVKEHRGVGGVMITASHNPAAFNGFKLKAHYGGPAEPALCQAVESWIDRFPVPRLAPRRAEKRIRTVDVRPAHFRALRKLVNFARLRHSGLRLAHDALFGVGAGCFEELLAGTSCRVTALNAQHDPNFGGINPEPVEKNYGRTAAWLRRHPQDFCLVTDGDADRVGGLDGRGGYVSTHALICLLLHHMVVNRGARGRVIKALTTTSMVDKMCAAWGLPLVETAVGFKYITAEMLKGDVLLGAEESGGIGFAGHIPERDGILAGLMLLELLATESGGIRRLLGKLERQFGPHHYHRVDTHFPLEKRATLMEYCREHPPRRLLKSSLEQVKTFDGVKYVARDGSWLMLRESGTEPIVRVYAEASSEAGARRLAGVGVGMTRRI